MPPDKRLSLGCRLVYLPAPRPGPAPATSTPPQYTQRLLDSRRYEKEMTDSLPAESQLGNMAHGKLVLYHELHPPSPICFVTHKGP